MKQTTLRVLFILLAGTVLQAGPVAGAGEAEAGRLEESTAELVRSLKEVEPGVEAAKARARQFVRGLEVNPVELRRQRGMKGIKFYVEYLNFCYDLSRHATPELRETIRKEVVDSSVATFHPEYHGLDKQPIKEFRQDVLSYLNACRLLKEFGIDVGYYLAEIEKILPRIREDFPNRGVNQRITFIRRLEALDLKAPATVAELLPLTHIRERTPLAKMERLDMYSLTHEVYSLTDDGKIPAEEIFTRADMEYFQTILPEMLRMTIAEVDVDLAAETLVCYQFLGLHLRPEYREGITFLLEHQNPNGSFGDYEKDREELAKIPYNTYDIDVGRYLHTTEVVVWALVGSQTVLNRLKG